MNLTHVIRMARCALLALLMTPSCCWADTTVSTPTEQAEAILAETGVQGGLIVHLGCGDGDLTGALRRNSSYTVLGLDKDAANVDRARRVLQSQGVYGQVTVDHWAEDDRLPLIDNLVNLLVVSDNETAPEAEMLRVLAPRGVAYVRTEDGWSKIVKPWPAEYDEWGHYLRDATNNAVSQDTVVGPPVHYQWIGSPEYLRHHDHMSGLSAMVSTGGRLFSIIDLGPRWSVQMPPKWTLVARDAFNGTILWQRPIPEWHAHLWRLKNGPAQLMRRLVAVDDTVYVTLAVGDAITALDAATGDLKQRYPETAGAEEILVDEGVVYALVHPEGDAYRSLSRESVAVTQAAAGSWNWDEGPRTLMALNAATGRVLWSKTGRVAPGSIAVAEGRMVFHNGDRAVCLDAASGDDIWTSRSLARATPMHVRYTPTLVLQDDVILFSGGENMTHTKGGKDTMTALSAATGETLWAADHPQSGYASAEDLFVIGGLVFCGETTSRGNTGRILGRDLHTGQVKVDFLPDDWGHMPHHRCHRAKATVNYLLTSRTGIEYIDLRDEHWTVHHWVRGSCNYGIMPANGLTYAPPHSCACYPLAKLTSFNALAPQRTVDALELTTTPRLVPGPAFQAGDLAQTTPSLEDWPTLRHDASRHGVGTTSVPTDLKAAWRTPLGGPLTAPVVADGRLLVASTDTHDVHALDAESGEPLWSFKAGARIDSPPTVWQDRVLFGSADGHVYCLRADSGTVAWRFRAAPTDLRMPAYEQLESVWPVHGSVLVLDGVVYCVAGRAMWLDGGLRMLRLDAETGRLLSETILDDKHPDTGENLQTELTWPNLPVALPDVLSSDGQYVYMRSQAFDLEGKRTEVVAPRNYEQQQGETAHLFSPAGFLDDAWWHRSHWMFGESFIGGAGGWYLAAYQAPSGRILSVDDTNVFGFGRLPSGYRGTQNTYHLFSCEKRPKLSERGPVSKRSPVFGEVRSSSPVYHWSESIPFLARALLVTDETLFAAGPAEVIDEDEVYLRHGDPDVQAAMRRKMEAYEGQHGSILMAVAADSGEKRSAYRLDSSPVFDGMAAARGRLYLSMQDGSVICLGSEGAPLEAADDIEPGKVGATSEAASGTTSHPDFQYLESVTIASSDIGYRIQGPKKVAGLALRQLKTPLAGRVAFDLQVRITPSTGSPDTPGNGFLAFGDAPEDGRLVKCGFRNASKRLFIVQGVLEKGESVSLAADVRSDAVIDLHVVVDLAEQTVGLTAGGQTVTAPLERPLDEISWIGYCVTSVTTDFGPLKWRPMN